MGIYDFVETILEMNLCECRILLRATFHPIAQNHTHVQCQQLKNNAIETKMPMCMYIILFSSICTLGGAGNKPNSIQN